MNKDDINNSPWVIVRLRGELYGLSGASVREMVKIPNIVKVPRCPAYVRGLINLRDSVLPLYDLRTRLGHKSILDENQALFQMIEERRNDHLRWLEELKASVKEEREFRLGTNPRACAFGRWFYAFKTNNLVFRSFLNKFEQPHDRIHALGNKVQELVAASRHAEALQLVETAENGCLKEMIELFSRFREEYEKATTEIAMILQVPGKQIAVSVDEVISVEKFDPSTVTPLSEATMGMGIKSEMIPFTTRRGKTSELVLCVDTDRIAA